MKMGSEKVYCQSDLLKMGFTQKMINDFLPEPLQVTNPYNHRWTPMKIWTEKTVKNAMRKTEFWEAKKEADKRKKAKMKKYANIETNLQPIV